jgi:hypothetical protein
LAAPQDRFFGEGKLGEKAELREKRLGEEGLLGKNAQLRKKGL